ARLLTEKPECKPWIKRIVASGGSANFGADRQATMAVLDSGVPLVLVPLTTTEELKLSPAQCQRVFSPGTALTNQVQCLYQLWDQENPVLADPLATMLCFDERFCTMEERHVV